MTPAKSASDAFSAEQMEEWRALPPLGKYEVSSFGRVRRASNQALKPLSLARSGVLVVNLYDAGIGNVRQVHSLVAQAFVGRVGSGEMVVHADGNRLNNHRDNLILRPLSKRRPLNPSGQIPPFGKLDRDRAQEIARRARAGEATTALAKEYGVSAPMISDIKHGRKWA